MTRRRVSGALAFMLLVLSFSSPCRVEAEPVNPSPVYGEMPPLFAPLFERNREWSYQVEWAAGEPIDDSGKKWDQRLAKWRETCKVSDVRQYEGFSASRIVCEPTAPGPNGSWPGAVPHARVFVGSAAGLWMASSAQEELPKDATALIEVLSRPPILPAVLSPVHSRVSKDDGNRTERWDITNGRRKMSWGGSIDAWCSLHKQCSGDCSEEEVCLAPGRGIVRSRGWLGGSGWVQVKALLER